MPDGGKRGVKRSSPGRAGDASEEGVSIIPLLLLPPSQKAILMAIIVQFSLISAQMIFRKEEEKRAQLVNISEMPKDVYDVPPLWMSIQRREIQNMLERLGVKFNQVLLGKRKRLEMYAEASLKRSYQKSEHIWTTYKEQRQKLNREYSQHFLTLFQQWDLDIKKTKKEEAKLANIFQQQLKIFQQARMIRIQRLNEIKHLYEKFSKNLEDLEKTHENFLIVAQHELQD